MLAKYNLKTLKGFIQSKVDKFIDDKCELDEFLYCMIRFLVRTRLLVSRESSELWDQTSDQSKSLWVLCLSFCAWWSPLSDLSHLFWYPKGGCFTWFSVHSTNYFIHQHRLTISSLDCSHLSTAKVRLLFSYSLYCFKQRNWTTLTLFTISWWTF